MGSAGLTGNIASYICGTLHLHAAEYKMCYFALAPKLKIDISPLKVIYIFLAIFVSNKALFLEYFMFDIFFWFQSKKKVI